MPPPAPPLPQIHSLSLVLQHFWQRENKCDKEINNIAGLLSLFDTHIQSKSTDFFFFSILFSASYLNLFLPFFYFMHHMLMLLKLLSFPSIILMHGIRESSLNHVLGHCAM